MEERDPQQQEFTNRIEIIVTEETGWVETTVIDSLILQEEEEECSLKDTIEDKEILLGKLNLLVSE